MPKIPGEPPRCRTCGVRAGHLKRQGYPREFQMAMASHFKGADGKLHRSLGGIHLCADVPCGVEGCEGEHYGRGLCYRHWVQDRDGTLPVPSPEVIARLPLSRTPPSWRARTG